jgi:hypothetical protein
MACDVLHRNDRVVMEQKWEKLRNGNEKMQQKIQKEHEKKPVEQKSSLASNKPLGMKR